MTVIYDWFLRRKATRMMSLLSFYMCISGFLYGKEIDWKNFKTPVLGKTISCRGKDVVGYEMNAELLAEFIEKYK